MLNEFVYKILVHERDIKGSVDSPQTIEFYFNFIGKFETPATEQGPTPEEILLMEKRQKIREKRHEAYLRRKSTGWQATYYSPCLPLIEQKYHFVQSDFPPPDALPVILTK